MKITSLIISLLLFSVNNAQTFTGGSGPIMDFQTIDIPVTVAVPQTSINTTTFGVETVCLNLTHTYLADLTIQLVAPGVTVRTISNLNRHEIQ